MKTTPTPPPTRWPINWDTTDKDRALIDKIVERAMALSQDDGISYNAKECSMDLTACHLNGCAIDLEKLLRAPDATFGHDVYGIRRFIDRTTGKIPGEFFAPRCMLPEQEGGIQ